MARPLTKCRSNGEVYIRPPTVEAAIDEALMLDSAALKRQLEIADRQKPGYFCSECLVHLIRETVRSGDQTKVNLVLPVLLLRCEANLRAKIPNGALPDAESLREEVLGQFSEMFASDGTGDNPNELDFFEVRFNRAFRTFRIDLVDKEINRLKNVSPLPAPSVDDESYDDVLARLSEAMRVPATQERALFLADFWEAINTLPPDECRAVVLCHVMGYKEESKDPDEVTAATLCNCSGRTIRNRLARAAAKLKRFKEDL